MTEDEKAMAPEKCFTKASLTSILDLHESVIPSLNWFENVHLSEMKFLVSE